MTKKNKETRTSNGIASDNPKTHDEKAPEIDDDGKKASSLSSMEDHDSSEEEVQKLKSLNGVLVNQTVETREQIDSLVLAKDELETELARYGFEKTELRSELDQVSDENLGLKIELDLVMGFLGDRFREMGVGVERLMMEKDDKEIEIVVLKREASGVLSKLEIEKEELKKVCDERDSIKNGFELQLEEVNRLKECVNRLEEKESDLEMMIGRLNSENEKLVKERKMKEEVIEGVNKEKIDLEKTVEDKMKEIDGLKREIDAISSVKNEIETVKNSQRGEIEELEKRLEESNESVHSLTKEKKALGDLVIRLDKILDESMEKVRVMLVEIDALGKEKTIKESELKKVTKEKNAVEKQMEMVNAQSFDKEKLISLLSQEKISLEKCIFSHEANLVKFNNKVDKLTQAVAVLQKECNDRTKTNEKLSCKVGELSNALAQVEIKREEALQALDEEKSRGEDLKAEVLKSEKLIKSTLEEHEKAKIERESLSSAKNDLESQSESWKREKDILEQKVVELRKAMDALETELESSRMDAKRSLVILKRAASLVSHGNQEKGTESYASELDSIEKAFKNKMDMIEEMKKEAETMKQSTEEAQKKKSFWTAVSSLTAIFAAASFAYASRRRL